MKYSNLNQYNFEQVMKNQLSTEMYLINTFRTYRCMVHMCSNRSNRGSCRSSRYYQVSILFVYTYPKNSEIYVVISFSDVWQWRIQDFSLGGGVDLRHGCFSVEMNSKRKERIGSSCRTCAGGVPWICQCMGIKDRLESCRNKI